MSENYDSDENMNEIDDDEIELDDDDLDEEDIEDSESMLEPQVKYLIYKDLYLNFWKSINLTQNIRNHLNLIHIYLVINSYKLDHCKAIFSQ